jgi:FkbM family methyltransferase
MGKLFWSLKLDFQFIFIVPNLSFYHKFDFIIRKYLHISYNILLGLDKLNIATVFGKKYFYNELTGLASLQRVYCESYTLVKFLPKNPIVLDVGANVGQFNFFCSHYLEAKRVFSIEPLPDCFELLKLNAITPSDCSNLLISNKEGNTEFYLDTASSQLSSIVKEGIHNVKEYITVSGVTLDEIFLKAEFNGIDLLKIDTEGSEYDVLLSAEKTLCATRFVLVEMSVLRKSMGNIFKIGSYLNGHDFQLISLLCKNNDKPEDIDGIFEKL